MERQNQRGDKPKFNKKKWRETQFSHKQKGNNIANWWQHLTFLVELNVINCHFYYFCSFRMGVESETGCYTKIQQNDEERQYFHHCVF